MTTEIRERLSSVCRQALDSTLDYSSEQVEFALPRDCVHGLFFEGYFGELFSEDELLELLVNRECFPRVVDLAVRGIHENKTLVLWLPFGESSYIDFEENDGLGPFRPVGVMSPGHFKLSREQLSELAHRWLSEGL